MYTDQNFCVSITTYLTRECKQQGWGQLGPVIHSDKKDFNNIA